MTNDEVIDLLTLMASYDRRTVGKADVAAWQLVVGELPFADAELAVVAHYGESREFAMPSDIRQRVKAIRAERIKQAHIPAPPHELTDDPLAYKAALAESVRLAAEGKLPPAPEMPAIVGPSERRPGAPVSLRGAIRQLRRQLGPARARAIEAPEDVAARQVAEQRGIKADRSTTEEAS